MRYMELTRLSFASKISYELFSFLHKLRVVMYLFKELSQFCKRWFFAFHFSKDKSSRVYKFYGLEDAL